MSEELKKEEICGCGHDHGHEEHDHEHHEHHDHDHHEHAHGDACGCGHDHGHEEHDHEHQDHHDHDHHEHAHGDACGCGHDHGHEEHDHAHHDHDHHEHAHGDACGCGHDHVHEEHDHAHHDHDHHEHAHGDACSCGHDHGHEEHEHHHTPGHPEDCQCEQCHPHAEYCDVCGESLANCTCHMPDDGLEKKVYILENLGCANCAAKMEKKIKELPGVKYATITYTTKQLRLSAENHAELLPKIQEICTSIESEVKVVPRDGSLPGAYKTKTYILENLGCANCAAKMEKKIRELEGVSDATITFTTKQLRLTAKSPDRYLPQIRQICTSIESEVVVVEKDSSPKSKDTLGSDVGRTSKKDISDNTKTLIQVVLGGILFLGGELLEHMGILPESLALDLCFVVAYVVLGYKIVLTAVKNLTKGQVFDENFLMTVATLGALIIGEYAEAAGVILFYRIGEYFEHVAVEKSRNQIMDAVDMRPEVVNLLIGEEVQTIPAQEAQVGDILLVRPGDRIPLDGVIVEGESRIDTSPITGEPVPVGAGFGDEVVSGCVNTSGQLKIRVEKMLEESMVTRILDSVENAAASKPQIDRFITKFARIYTPFVVALALFTAIVPSIVTGRWSEWIYTALTFLVMSCPCALVLSVPLAFFSGIGAGSKKGILFKGGVSLEALSHVNAVVMDKTGTITEGNFVVQQVISDSNFSQDELLLMCASCEQVSTHPIGVSIVTAAKDKGMELEKPYSLEEIAGHGIRAVLAEGELLCGNRKLMDKYQINLDNYEKTAFGSEVLIAVNGVYAGHVVISDTIKSDAKEAIAKLKKQNITTAMLTGDAEDSAQAVAAETGIDEVHAKLLPQDKLTELNQIRNTYGSVMFVGDGINDAPVLAGADVGAAMGSGADAAIEAADVVFMTSSMESIPQAVAIARSTSAISWQNVVFALVVKVIVMVLGLCGYASMWMAIFADTGVAMLCVLNSIRILYRKK